MNSQIFVYLVDRNISDNVLYRHDFLRHSDIFSRSCNWPILGRWWHVIDRPAGPVDERC